MTEAFRGTYEKQAQYEALDGLRTAGSIEEARSVAEQLGAQMTPIGFSVRNEWYGYPSLDIRLPNGNSAQRFFIHQTFPPDNQEEVETILDNAGTYYFPAQLRTDTLTVRKLPLISMPLISHNMTKPHVQTLIRDFVLPVLHRIYGITGTIPSEEMLGNAVHIEDLTSLRGIDRIVTGLRFIPPYQLEPVAADDFKDKVAANASRFGEYFKNSLRTALD